jgi:pyrimidine precursor biosynthesis enzyme
MQILFIGNEEFIQAKPDKVKAFMKAVKRGTEYMFQQPADAYELFVEMKPHMNSDVNRKIFQRSFRYMSLDMKNVQRDWDKVTKYCKRLGIVDDGFEQNQTNDFLTWSLNPEFPAGFIQPAMETGALSKCKGDVCKTFTGEPVKTIQGEYFPVCSAR